MTAADYSKFLLALVMYREARGEGQTGMLAVGHVIANRCHMWGKTYHDVILGENQFTSMSVHADPNDIAWPVLEDEVFYLAENVYSGMASDVTNGALYYADETFVTSGWYEREIISSGLHPVLVKIGRHTFRK
jgi:spore germination cell wall hydrolase CwlJ-like protein